MNLEDNEKLQDYLDSIGGRPDPKTPARSDSTSKKRKLEEPSGSKQRGAKKAKEDTPTLSMKKGTTASGGRRKSAKGESQKEEPDWNPPPGSWEESIINIDTMEIGEDGILYAYVVWKDQKRSQHPSAVVNMKCPQKVSAVVSPARKSPKANGSVADVAVLRSASTVQRKPTKLGSTERCDAHESRSRRRCS